MSRVGVWGVGAMLLLPGVAWAQAGEAQVEAVTVTGQAQEEVRTSIDRTSYDVTKDLNATSGSVSDVLRNIPSVQVDLQGNVSVRGGGVTIMIDGKPAPELRGATGATALQMLPAGRFERVEVATNPSAAESPEGGAIINLISRQGRGEGRSWQARGNIGERGQFGGGLYGTYNADKLALNGDVSFRRRATDWTTRDERHAVDPVSGDRDDRLAQLAITDVTDGVSANAGATYDPSAAVRLTSSVRYSNTPVVGLIVRDERATSGPERTSRRSDQWFSDPHSLGVSAGYLRKIGGEDDHTLAIDLRGDRTLGQLQDRFDISGTAGNAYEQLDSESTLSSQGVKAEYKRAGLTAGAQVDGDDQTFLYTARRGASEAAAVIDPAFTGAFDYERTVAAVYATYQAKVGKATLLPGIRLEDVRQDLHERATGFASAPGYTEFYPSMHVEYPLSEALKLKASYSRRVVRPGAESLNPARFLNGELTYQRGNPLLQPIFGDAFETAVEYRRGQSLYRASVYWRQGRGMITNVYTPLPGGELEVMPQNMGRHKVGGLEMTANGKLSAKLSYNVNGNLSWREVDTRGFGIGRYETTSFSGRGTLNWDLTAKDAVQIAGAYVGKSGLPQGYYAPTSYVNLGYRRKVSERVSAVLTVADAFETLRSHTVIDTPQLQSVINQEGRTRIVGLALTYAMGGQAKPAGFEF